MIKGYPKKAIGPKMTLREWFDKLKITPDAETGRPDAYRSSVKKDRNGFMSAHSEMSSCPIQSHPTQRCCIR